MAIRDAWNMCALTSEMVHNLQNRTNQRILRRSHGDSRKPRPGRGAGEMVLHVSEAGPQSQGKGFEDVHHEEAVREGADELTLRRREEGTQRTFINTANVEDNR